MSSFVPSVSLPLRHSLICEHSEEFFSNPNKFSALSLLGWVVFLVPSLPKPFRLASGVTSFDVVSKLESNIELLSRVRGGVSSREAWLRGDDRAGVVGGADMVDDPCQSTGDAEFVSIADAISSESAVAQTTGRGQTDAFSDLKYVSFHFTSSSTTTTMMLMADP